MMRGTMTPKGMKGDKGDAGAPKRTDTYSKATDATGMVSFVYATPFTDMPLVFANLTLAVGEIAGYTLVAESLIGCTVRVTKTTLVTVVGISVLGVAVNQTTIVKLAVVGT